MGAKPLWIDERGGLACLGEASKIFGGGGVCELQGWSRAVDT